MNEQDLLKLIFEILETPPLEGGVGDDCAVIKKGPICKLFTTDALVEGIHFDLSYFSPFFLGRKLGAVNLSDIAAMGGVPKYALLVLGFSTPPTKDFVKEFFCGLKEKLSEYGASLVGGDIVRNPKALFLSLSLYGEISEKEVIFRQGASLGDLVFLSRPVGASSVALELLQKGYPCPYSLFKAHVDPVPEINIARALAQKRIPSAMIDISDGLALDLERLSQASNVGIEIKSIAIPIEEKILSQKLSKHPLDYALYGGEDFALIFTAPAYKKTEIINLFASQNRKVYEIGRVISRKGVWLRDQEESLKRISGKGYIHTFN